MGGGNLEKAEYKLKTLFKLSKTGYKYTKSHPIHQLGQGATNSPALWMFISSILFDCYDNKAAGAIFWSLDEKVKVTICMVGFVDDTSSQVSNFTSHP